MPNGRTGGFYVIPTDLKRVLDALSSEAQIGNTPERSISAAEAIDLVAKYRGKDIPIEQQGYSWYYMHLGPVVSVSDSSPLYEALRREHARWLAERMDSSRRKS